MVGTYEIVERVPSYDEYYSLCVSVGWKDYMNFEVAEEAIANSLFACVVKQGDETVGMGRIVGDGKIYFYVQDIVVNPEHQGHGIGQLIMEKLVEYLKANAPEGAFVGLFASAGKDTFYERFGFKDYSPNMTGMFRVF